MLKSDETSHESGDEERPTVKTRILQRRFCLLLFPSYLGEISLHLNPANHPSTHSFSPGSISRQIVSALPPPSVSIMCVRVSFYSLTFVLYN